MRGPGHAKERSSAESEQTEKGTQGCSVWSIGYRQNPYYIIGNKYKNWKADTHCVEDTFLLEQSLETGSTVFSRGLALIALKVIFGLRGRLNRGEVRRGLVKIEVGGCKL